MTSLRSPQDLCDRLGIYPTNPAMTDAMHTFYNETGDLDISGLGASRTAAVCALWRVMRNNSSRCIVIASSKAHEAEFMDYLFGLTTNIDPALCTVTRWPHSRLMKIGDSAGHELRFVDNWPRRVAGIHADNITWVVLGASSTDIKFNEMVEAVKGCATSEDHRIITVW